MFLTLVFLFGSGAVLAVNEVTNRVVQKVHQEAVRVDRRVKVSDDLRMRLSPSERQEQFYTWMDNTSAVRRMPWIQFALGIGIQLKILGRDACGWLHVLVCLPCPILGGARLALEMNGCSKEAQSLASLLHTAYTQMIVPFLLLAFSDSCFGSFGPSLASSPATAAAHAAMLLLHFHAATPCTMRHFPVLCCITGLGNIIGVYTQYLQQNGGLSFIKSDPWGIGFVAITCSTLAALALSACLRLYLARNLMVMFFRSLRS